MPTFDLNRPHDLSATVGTDARVITALTGLYDALGGNRSVVGYDGGLIMHRRDDKLTVILDGHTCFTRDSAGTVCILGDTLATLDWFGTMFANDNGDPHFIADMLPKLGVSDTAWQRATSARLKTEGQA